MNKSASTVRNPVIIKQSMNIGSGNAETDDEYLFDCFVDYGPVQQFLNVRSAAMVLSGRTGAGKTALIRHVEHITENSVELDPSEMSMNYVSNSDALRFLQAIGADLELLFQVLWKHVICIEFIRLRWHVDNEDKSRGVFQRISERFNRDARKDRALKYLREWEGKFWITMDQNVKELTESVERKILHEFSGEYAKFKAGGQYEKRLSQGQKSELVARSRKIINSDQLQELSGIIDILSTEDSADRMKSFYILIDKLDEHWVDESIRFRLIRSLLESLRSFRKISNLKILVALRADIRERVLQETNNVTFQREKFDDYAIDLKWNKNELRSLIDKRLNLLFKRQYTNGSILFSDIFPSRIGIVDTFEWMVNRTLMRPRDIIAFVNECISSAAGGSLISVTNVRDAAITYSGKRRDALLQEWFSSFPTLKHILLMFVDRDKSLPDLEAILNSGKVDELALTICSQDQVGYDPMHELCSSYVNNKGTRAESVLLEAAAIAYRVGAVGLKLNTSEPFSYSHVNEALLSPGMMTMSSKVKMHAMLHGAFRINE